MLKFTLRLGIFILAFLCWMQFPAFVHSYKVGASAIIAELKNDYDRIHLFAASRGMEVEGYIEEAKNTDNPLSGEMVEMMSAKIPRYLLLREHIKSIDNNDIPNIMLVVFWKHDEIVYNSTVETFKPAIHWNLSLMWYLVAVSMAILCLIIYEIIFLFFSFFIKGLLNSFRKKS